MSWRHIGFIGDSPDQLKLGLFSDADFAGDRADTGSTSGVFLALYGDHSFFPLSGQSKKQTALSHSTVEAVIVVADHAVRTSGLLALQVWERLLDNQATARITSTGRAPTLPDIKRTHSVSVAWIRKESWETTSVYMIVSPPLWPPKYLPSALCIWEGASQHVG